MAARDHTLGGDAKRGPGNLDVFPDGRAAQLARQTNRNLVVLERLRPVKPRSTLIAHLEEVASRPEDRMLAELIADLIERQGGNLCIHETMNTLNPVTEAVVDRAIEARPHCKPCPDSKHRKSRGDDQEIPCRKAD